jgi:serine/threonine-protein kinase PknK
LIGKTLSHFHILKKLGQGGMGEVFLARDTNLGREVALKILPSDFARDRERLHRFIHEAKTASALNHVNVARIYEIRETNGTHFIVMEYIEGQALDVRIRGRALETGEIRSLGIQIANALDAAHSKGITHRDIKPANIMVTTTGEIKVLDFGLAKVASQPNAALDDSSTALETQLGILLGTVQYMSPEQALGREVDHRSDIFSFGVVLYEMATGQRPFSGRTTIEVINRIINSQPTAVNEINDNIPGGLQRIIKKCMAKLAEARYQTVRDLLSDLTDAEFGGPEPSSIPNNLPLQLTSFIGREKEMNEIKRLLSKNRLVTLLAMGGIGKTRLALEVAARLLGQYPDGVWFVDLAPLSDPALVPQAVTSVLSIREEPNRPPMDTLIQHSKTRQVLLILDNCEHLIDACAELADRLLHTCPNLRLMATSREILRVGGETVLAVPSLSVCDPGQLASNDSITQYEAVRLFVDRTVAVQPSFTVTSQNARDLAELCHRLDGMPLAIELAAARMTAFSLEEINEHLEDRFRLLTAGSRAALPRQQTLRATIDWSYDLLSEVERLLFRRLAAFRGSWTLEAAEQVCAADGIQERHVVELLAQLMDKSLVSGEGRTRKPRYRLLETVLRYAEEKLVESDEVEDVRRRHCHWILNLAEHAHDKLEGPEQGMWLDELEHWTEDLRSALDWGFENDRTAVLRLAAALGRFWFQRSYFWEGTQWLKRILARRDSFEHQRERVKALYAATGFARTCGDNASAVSFGEESLSINRELHDERGVAVALANLGVVVRHQAQYVLAKSYITQALQTFRELDDERGIAFSLNQLGLVALRERAYRDADTFFNESLGMFRRVGNTREIASLLDNVGDAYLGLGNYSLAGRYYRDSLATFSKLGDKAGVADALYSLAELAGIVKQSRRAVRLYAAAQTLRNRVGIPIPLYLREEYEQNISNLCTELSNEGFTGIWTEGCAMTLEEAIAYGLEDQIQGMA